MSKPVLIVCRDANLFGSYTACYDIINENVEKIISGPYSEALMNEVIFTLKNHQITTIISRGIWYKKLLEHEYIINNSYIHVEQMIIDSRIWAKQLADLTTMGFKKIAVISVNSKGGRDLPKNDISDFSNAISIHSRIITDTDHSEEILNELKNTIKVDAFWGDAGDFIEHLSGYTVMDFMVRPETLSEMIKNAVTYHKSFKMEQHTAELLNFLVFITGIVSEGVLMVSHDGTIFHHNDNSVIEKLFKGLDSTTNLKDVLGITTDELLKLPANALLNIRNHGYIINTTPMDFNEGGQSEYAVVIDRRSTISNMELSARTQISNAEFPARYCFDDILSYDPRTKRTIQAARAYANYDETVLIHGETGTGKELFSSSIHRASLRHDNPFIAINCSTFSETLIDSELFGYEKGSFTGALATGKKGLFEMAHKGTIFLDEISELPISLQARLLRVLQEKTIRRIGGKEEIPIDVRVIAATNKDLLEQCRKGLFRYDLYYRLAVLELRLRPLRERKLDIIPLFKHFLNQNAENTSRKLIWDSDDIFNPLLQYSWNGNIRELENVALRTSLLAKNLHLESSDIINAMAIGSAPEIIKDASTFTTAITDDLNELDREYVLHLMNLMQNKDEVCNYLHISKPTLWRKINYSREPESGVKKNHD